MTLIQRLVELVSHAIVLSHSRSIQLIVVSYIETMINEYLLRFL